MRNPSVRTQIMHGALCGLALISLIGASTQSIPALAQGQGGDQSHDIKKVNPHALSQDVRSLPQVAAKPKVERELNEPQGTKQASAGQLEISPTVSTVTMPSTVQNFRGMSRGDTCSGGTCGAGIPPDTNGDVGSHHYIQAVNSSFAIYSKTGSLLASFTEDALWAGSGQGQCDGNSQGDPVVLYDALADRWILTDMAFGISNGSPTAPYYICIAVSKTSDPVSGGWYLYGVRTDTGASGQPPVGTLDDYPKFGIWTDCLYFSANGFNSSGNYAGGEFGSFSRSDMYAGRALTGSLGFRASTNDYFTMIPSNLSAPGSNGVPPAGTPDYYVQESLSNYSFLVRKFTPGSNCSAGTLGTAVSVSQASYTTPGQAIVPQPGTSIKLDSLGERMMQKVQYRKVGSAESLWVVHTFRSSSSGPTGLQWAQINVTGGTISTSPKQQQLYNPGDGIYRWMGSIAADKAGNAAVGFSTSALSSYPSIAYAGRLASDPLNSLPQGEKSLAAGSASQTNTCGGNPCARWGDYSSMSVDPVDGCTFWYTSEYYTSQTAGSNGRWDTRIGAFDFASCAAPATMTKTFYSNATQDGWVLESSETSGLGGSLNNTATTFRLGDDASNRQYRSILSFDTSGLPDNAVITSVQLKIKQAGVVGSNPFNSLGNIVADIRSGSFSNDPSLQTSDFQAASSKSSGLTFTNSPTNGWYTRSLSSTNFGYVNLAGTTQFRLRFQTDDNNNLVADYLKFYSGDYITTTTDQPTLVVKYYVP